MSTGSASARAALAFALVLLAGCITTRSAELAALYGGRCAAREGRLPGGSTAAFREIADPTSG